MAQHHCQTSLEDFINVSGPEPLAADQRARMKDNFYSIVNHFRAAETSDNVYSRLCSFAICFSYRVRELDLLACLSFYSRGFWPAHYSTVPQHIALYSKAFMEGIMNFF
ncbi:conserved hypothetical protein [Histoplasma capsulatum G186AR]|uniref:Uncharacterized protein n=1 Tax=Ajellomyces capsulatus (strain G186AR / H82 / ATCC MYA-2454 / RMSCC 2432) TaxID=447093 RepID=C0NXG9_AJECG|nr:uncharacterized protein HCBG_08161 [Histoplasma capsulatum G186AR]EEH04035.1 conserved hypothetical protein [Histoplasma capsulatum G186AR]